MDRPKAQRFEDLRVYQQGRELANAIYAQTRQSPFSRDFDLVGQIRRAAISIVSNIAEGFERGSRVEFVHFLFIAKGSCGEVRAQLQLAYDQKYLAQETFSTLYKDCVHLGASLSNFIYSIRQKDYKGEKYRKLDD